MRAIPSLALLSLLSLCGCTSTTFTSTWKAPDAVAVNPQGHRVAAVFISRDESSRRVAEDVLVRKLNEHGAEGIATYSMIPSGEVKDFEAVKASLREAGVDGVVTMRVIDEKEKVRVTYSGPDPMFAPYYWRFSGYWGYGWGFPYSPAEVSTTTVLRIETLVYSLERDALLWAGTSRTSDPANIEKLVAEVADAAARQMTKDGLLAASDTSR